MAAWSSSEIRLAELRRRWEEDPTSHLFLQLAEEYRRRGDLEQALTVLRRGMPANPSIAAEVALGRCLLANGNADQAAQHLLRAIDRDPAQLVAYRHLIEAHLQLGDGSEAARCLEIYRQLNTHDVDLMELSERVERLIGTGHAESADVAEPVQPEAECESALSVEQSEPDAAPTEVARFEPSLPSLPSLPPLPERKPSPLSAFSGLWKSEKTDPEPSPIDTSALAGLSAATERLEEPMLARSVPSSLFDLQPIEEKSFDLKSLPLRPLRSRSSWLVPADHFARPRHNGETAEGEGRRQDHGAPPERPVFTGPDEHSVGSVEPEFNATATLGRIYLDQGHAEDAARIYSEVKGGSEPSKRLGDGLPDSPSFSTDRASERPVALASFVPLALLRSRPLKEDRRLLVVEAYLNRLTEAKRHVS